LKGVTDDFNQQVQIARLLLRDEALEKFNDNYVDPVPTPVDPAVAQDIQAAA
jgi:hypothetical protein